MSDPRDTTQKTEEEWIELPFSEFDQTMDGGWRTVAHSGNFNAAARIIERYLEHRRDLEDGQHRILHFHAGQMRAYSEDYESAISHFRQSFEEPERQDSPVLWNPYVAATIAFLEGDKETMLRCREEIAAGPTFNGSAPNLNVVDRMIARFGEPYSSAYG